MPLRQQIVSTLAVAPHMLGSAPEYDDAYALAMVESMGLDPLTCGIREVESLAFERHRDALIRELEAHDRYTAARAAEHAAWPWWRRQINLWTGR